MSEPRPPEPVADEMYTSPARIWLDALETRSAEMSIRTDGGHFDCEMDNFKDIYNSPRYIPAAMSVKREK